MKEFTKEDLKPCMLVKLRSGCVYYVIETRSDGLMLLDMLDENAFSIKEHFDINLKNYLSNEDDIVEVYGFSNYVFKQYETFFREQSWSREKYENELAIKIIESRIEELEVRLKELKNN